MMKNGRMVKKVMSMAVLGVFSMGMMTGCSGGNDQQQQAVEPVDADGGMQTVGIVQLVTHGALDESNRGIVDGLADNGFIDGENLTIMQHNAQGEQANLQSIAQQFLSSDVDLICAIATPAAQVMASATEDIPIVATAITSFETANLVESDEAPGTNVTGTHDMSPIADQMDLLMQIAPDTKTVGVIYTSSEVNSQVQVDILKEYAAANGLTVEEATISSVNDIQQAAQSLVTKVDAIYLPTDNNIASAMPQVVAVTDEAGIITVCGEESMVSAGGTITYGISFYNIGYDAGVMAAQILKGEGEPAAMAIGGPKTEDLKLVINQDAVERLGITIPEDVAEKAEMV